MSEESKEKLQKIKKLYETVEEGTKKVLKESPDLQKDKELVKKIEKVQKEAGEVVKHIEEKTEP